MKGALIRSILRQPSGEVCEHRDRGDGNAERGCDRGDSGRAHRRGAAAKQQAWGSTSRHRAAPRRECAPAGGSAAAKQQAWGSTFLRTAAPRDVRVPSMQLGRLSGQSTVATTRPAAEVNSGKKPLK